MTRIFFLFIYVKKETMVWGAVGDKCGPKSMKSRGLYKNRAQPFWLTGTSGVHATPKTARIKMNLRTGKLVRTTNWASSQTATKRLCNESKNITPKSIKLDAKEKAFLANRRKMATQLKRAPGRDRPKKPRKKTAEQWAKQIKAAHSMDPVLAAAYRP